MWKLPVFILLFVQLLSARSLAKDSRMNNEWKTSQRMGMLSLEIPVLGRSVGHSKYSIFAIWNPKYFTVCVIRDEKKFFKVSALLEK